MHMNCFLPIIQLQLGKILPIYSLHFAAWKDSSILRQGTAQVIYSTLFELHKLNNEWKVKT